MAQIFNDFNALIQAQPFLVIPLLVGHLIPEGDTRRPVQREFQIMRLDVSRDADFSVQAREGVQGIKPIGQQGSDDLARLICRLTRKPAPFAVAPARTQIEKVRDFN